MSREEGQTLSNLAANNNIFKGFELFGIVKEVDVDNEGLIEFYNKYFSYPLYLDKKKTFYANVLGNRKFGLLKFNPIGMYRGMKRSKKKQIEGTYKGEGFLKGGVIIFDKDGRPRAIYKEETGSELPVNEIIQAVEVIINENENTH